MSADKAEEYVWDLEHLELAIAAAGVALWTWNVDSDQLTMDKRAFDLWGVPRGPSVTFEDLSAHIHSADRDRVRAAFAATRAIVGPYEIDFRVIRRTGCDCGETRRNGQEVLHSMAHFAG